MGFPTRVHGQLLQIPYQSHLDYYYRTHLISHIVEKKGVPHAINSHVKPAQTHVFYQGNLRAFDSRLLNLTYTHSGDVTRSDVRRLSFFSPEKVIRFWVVCHLVVLSVIPSVIPSICHHFVSTHHLENNCIEFNQILYVH